MFKRLNNALPGLLCGILLYGALLQLIGVWFVEDKLRYTTGLWIGIACALFMVIHMAISIEDSVSLDEQGAKKKTIASAMLRYVVVLVVLVVTIYFNLGMMLPAFLGLLGLKISAYLQPAFQRLQDRFAKKRR
jgi:hypothetical protein